MSRKYESRGDITYVIVTFQKTLLRMNVKTGVTWYFKDGYWLPVKES